MDMFNDSQHNGHIVRGLLTPRYIGYIITRYPRDHNQNQNQNQTQTTRHSRNLKRATIATRSGVTSFASFMGVRAFHHSNVES